MSSSRLVVVPGLPPFTTVHGSISAVTPIATVQIAFNRPDGPIAWKVDRIQGEVELARLVELVKP